MTPKTGYRINLSGKTFNRWTVLRFYERSRNTTFWLCRCQCGVERPVMQSNLSCGHSKSCGCLTGSGLQHSRKGWVEDGTGYIPLTKGQVALVDAPMVEYLQRWNWYASSSHGGKFYAHRWGLQESGKRHMVHMAREILDMEHSDPRNADHINLDTLDNRIANLRVATDGQNAMNCGLRKDNKTGVKGVSVHKRTGKYLSSISVERTWVNLGLSDTLEEASKLYAEAAAKLHGEFARIS